MDLAVKYFELIDRKELALFEPANFLKSGSPARLFPVLSTTSKEGRTTSIVLACMSMVRELGEELLGSLGQRVGKRGELYAYTEVVFENEQFAGDRPDGLIILRNGKREWRALIETKIGKAQIKADQVERYRQIARHYRFDCVVTISNQFASSPDHHPLANEINKRLKIPVYHWSWMFVLTLVDLLYSNDQVVDADQKELLNELRRFLSHESAGVQGFDRMPPEWSDLVRLASSGGQISKSSDEAKSVVSAWHQETRDLSLIMTRKLDTLVRERLTRKQLQSPGHREKSALEDLCADNELRCSLEIPDAASSLEVSANLSTRSIAVSMTVRAPEDRKSSKARLNWLLRQLPNDLSDNYYVKFNWPGRAHPTQVPLSDARSQPDIVEKERAHLQVNSFEVLSISKLGARFGQQTNFVSELESAVPDFYETIGQNLSAWKKPAPKVRDEKVTISEIADESDAIASESD